MLPPQVTTILICVVVFVVGVAGGAFAGFAYRKKIAEKEIGSAEKEATRIINEAIKAAEAKKTRGSGRSA